MSKAPIKVGEPFKIAADWNQLAAKLKAKFPRLTESDLLASPGKENDMLKRIEARLHKSRFEVQSILRNLSTPKE